MVDLIGGTGKLKDIKRNTSCSPLEGTHEL